MKKSSVRPDSYRDRYSPQFLFINLGEIGVYPDSNLFDHRGYSPQGFMYLFQILSNEIG